MGKRPYRLPTRKTAFLWPSEMLIHYFSDIHVEFGSGDIAKRLAGNRDADVIICAGDLKPSGKAGRYLHLLPVPLCSRQSRVLRNPERKAGQGVGGTVVLQCPYSEPINNPHPRYSLYRSHGLVERDFHYGAIAYE